MKKTGLITFMIVMLFIAVIVVVAQEESITYNKDILPIINQYGCTDCHDFPYIRLYPYETLISQLSEQTITLNLPIVYPSKPDSSVIIWRIDGQLPSGAPINRMPNGGAKLPQVTIDLFRTWIEQGANKDIPVGVGKIHTWSEIKKKYN